MKYKALICDVDGTLIVNKVDALPSQKVRDTVAKAKSKTHIGLATSRPQYLARPIFEHLQLSGPSILHGGAEIVDITTGTYYSKEYISKEDIKKLYAVTKKLGMSLYVDEETTHTAATDDYNFRDLGGAVVLAINQEEAEILIKEAQHINTMMFHKIPSWTSGKIDVSVTPLHATKQQGIQKVAEVLGISTDEIIGVGDGYNDFPLLMACGLKVAMGNAVDDLKAIADYIAPSVEEDGVADVIEKFILNG